LLLRETSTLGVRISTAERRVAPRKWIEVETEFGVARVKVSPYGASPEFDDCAKLAREGGVPLKAVMAAAMAAWNELPAESKQ
jgi:hypothetical protein